MLASSALVLMITAPSPTLFYSGLVRKKNILGVMTQCPSLTGLMSVLWEFCFSWKWDRRPVGLAYRTGGRFPIYTSGKRRWFTAEKAQVIRRHLSGRERVSKLIEEFSLQPSVIHNWVNRVLALAETAFYSRGRGRAVGLGGRKSSNASPQPNVYQNRRRTAVGGVVRV